MIGVYSRISMITSTAIVWATLLVSAPAFGQASGDLARAMERDLAGAGMREATVASSAPDAGGVALSGISFASSGDDPARVTIGRIVARGPVEGGGVRSGRVTFERIGVTVGAGPLRKIDRAEVEGFSGSLAALTALLALGERQTAETTAALRQIRAGRITAPEVAETRRSPGRVQTVTYRDVLVEELIEGKVRSMRASGASMTAEGGRQAQRAATGAIRMEGVDLTAMATRAAGSIVALESASIEAIRTEASPGAQPVSIDAIRLGRVTVLPGDRSLQDVGETLNRIGPMENADAADRRRAAEALTALVSRIQMASLSMEGLKGEGAAREPFSIGRVTFRGFAGGVLEAIEVAAFAGKDRREQETRIGRILIEEIDGGGLVTWGEQVARGEARAGDTPPAQAIPHVRRLAIEDAGVKDPQGRALGGMRRFEVTAGPRIGLAPTRLAARIVGLETEVRDPAQRRQLELLGLEDKVTMDAALDLEFREQDKEIRLNTLSINIGDVGEAALSASVGGVDRKALEDLPASAQTMALTATVGPLRLTYKEAGAIASLISHFADQAGVEESDFLTMVKGQLIGLLAGAVQDRDAARRIGAALSAFLDDPQSLTVDATPKGALNLGTLGLAGAMGPLGLLNLFDFKVEANR